MLECAKDYWQSLAEARKQDVRFLHVSTDEVYGSLNPDAPAFPETNRYEPNSPYSASKASSDHLVRAYHHTYRLPVLITNCSNNYVPYQFSEKLISLVIHNALAHKVLPVYGDGLQIRDWLYVGDHCNAIRTVLERGASGEVYNIGGALKRRILMLSIQCVISLLCYALSRKETRSCVTAISSLTSNDHSGHDRRYAIDAARIETELGWRPTETFGTGLRKTVEWYLGNAAWVEMVVSGEYRQWIKRQYA